VRAVGGLAGWRIRRLQALAAGDLRTLDAPALARAVGLSPFHFTRAFKQTIGVTPGRWLINLRMERAKAMLASGDGRVADVARTVGYSGTAPFTRAFIAHTGLAPQAYRRR
jgi:AraC family transcriptional regulator